MSVSGRANQKEPIGIQVSQKKSHTEKIEYMGKMQRCHENATGEIVDTVFSLNPGKRDELVHEGTKYPITLIDFADIPQSVSDQHLLLLISSMLDKTYFEEKKSNPERKNIFLLRNSNDEVIVSPELLRIMERKLKNAIDVLLKMKLITEQHLSTLKECFTTDDQDNIIFKDQSQLIDFLRKTPIKNSDRSGYEKAKNILIVCSLLKQMLRHHDFKDQKKNIHHVRELLEQYVRGDLLSMLDWEAKDSNTEPIKDITHVDYFSDKIFIIRRELLEKYNIHYYKDIHTEITYRAKSDESIQDKLMIEPTAKTASMLHDLGGLKYVVLGEAQKEERVIVLYLNFLMYAEREQKYNPRSSTISPSNDDNQAFMPGGKYENNEMIIKEFLNEMSVKGVYDGATPLLKDKGIMPLDPTSKEGRWELDYEILEKLNIVDRRFIHLLEKAVEKKNDDYMKQKEMSARRLNIRKKMFFSKKVLEQKDNEQNDIWWALIRKQKEFTAKAQKIIPGDITSLPQQNSHYRFGMNEKGLYIYDVETPDTHYNWYQYQAYYKKFKELWTIHEKQELSHLKLNKVDHKGAWSDGKTASNVRIGYQDHQKLPLETQVLGENELRSLPLIDEHVIFNPAKKLLVYGRNNSGVLSLGDIYEIVDQQVIRMINSYPDKYCENKQKTFQDLVISIEEDPTILPAQGTFREKIIYNFIYHRGLKQQGNIYLTKYYDNLKYHELVPEEENQ